MGGKEYKFTSVVLSNTGVIKKDTWLFCGCNTLLVHWYSFPPTWFMHCTLYYLAYTLLACMYRRPALLLTCSLHVHDMFMKCSCHVFFCLIIAWNEFWHFFFSDFWAKKAGFIEKCGFLLSGREGLASLHS